MTEENQANVVPLKQEAPKKAVKKKKPSKAKNAAKPKAAAQKATVTTKSEKTETAVQTAKAITEPKAPMKQTAEKTPAKKAVKKKSQKAVKTVSNKAAKKAVKKAPAKRMQGVKTKVQATLKPTPIIENIKKETTMKNQNFDFTKISQQAANASRENVEAFIKSGTIFAKGFEELMKTAAALTQTAAEKQAQFAKEVMSSKTLNEFAEAQNKVAQNSFNELMVNTTKLSEMSVKLLSEASEPINKVMTKTITTAQKQAA